MERHVPKDAFSKLAKAARCTCPTHVHITQPGVRAGRFSHTLAGSLPLLWHYFQTSSCIWPSRRYNAAVHEEPRYCALVDKENQQPTVHVTFKHPARRVATPTEYLNVLKDNMFNATLNNRLFKISRKHDPPFYSAQVGSDSPCLLMFKECQPGCPCTASLGLLVEASDGSSTPLQQCSLDT